MLIFGGVYPCIQKSIYQSNRKLGAQDFVAIKFTTPDSHTEDIKTIAMEKGRHGWYTKNRAFFGVPPKKASVLMRESCGSEHFHYFPYFPRKHHVLETEDFLVRQIPSISTGTA